MITGAVFTRQLLLDGVTSGLAIGLVAVGIVLVYRATRVINFAVGNLGLVGASVLSLMVVQYHVPFWVSLAAGLAVGTAFAVLAELAVIRRLFRVPRVILLVATIGIAQLALSVTTALPKVRNAEARFPVPLGSTWHLWGFALAGPQLTIIITAPALIVALTWFLRRTSLGKTIEAAAVNPDLARLSGVSPKVVSAMTWAIAGFISTVAVILIAGQAGTATDLSTLGPDTLVRALAAAVIAGMTSYRRALIAGVAVGLAQSVVGFNFLNQPGLIDFLLLLAVLVSVWFVRDEGYAATQAFSFTSAARPIPEKLRGYWWIRNLDRGGLVGLGLVAFVVPLIVTQPSRILLYSTILAYAICACSLTVLTGWAGQLSLGQMAFAGIGALTAARFTTGISLNIGWGRTRLIDATFAGDPFWLSIVIATAVTAAAAAIIGAISLRVRGLSLAVTTFAFALAAEQYLYYRPILSGGSEGTVPFARGSLFGINMVPERNYYYAVLAILAVVLVCLGRLRRSGIGRTTIAVRENAIAAAAYTVRTGATQMRAFVLGGALAGLGGALLAGAVQDVPYGERFFLVGDSLSLVALAVIGGLGSVSGPVLGALWVVGLPAFAPDNNLVPLLTSSLGLLVLLLYFPGGLVGLAYRCREAIIEWATSRVEPVDRPRPTPTTTLDVKPPRLVQSGPVLTTSGVSVRFGGVTAVDGVSISVQQGEILGLIGANGAGKSTLMNAIGGFVNSTGSIRLFDREISGMRPAQRSAAGIGRTFQTASLFPELTVRESIEVSLEALARSRLVPTLLVLPNSVRSERRKRGAADDLLDFLGLGPYAEHFISELSTGTRRIVELAALLAMRSRLLCLDEPTAGVAQRETEAFGPLLIEVRRELGAAMVIIEHDMPLVMGVSDRVYCLETGSVIAEGAPSAVRQDPRVISSYLGTDERAIRRSAAGPMQKPDGDIPSIGLAHTPPKPQGEECASS